VLRPIQTFADPGVISVDSADGGPSSGRVGLNCLKWINPPMTTTRIRKLTVVIITLCRIMYGSYLKLIKTNGFTSS
jgi:hypothetical protein